MIAIIKILTESVEWAARVTTAEPVTLAPGLTRPANTRATAAHVIMATIMGAAPAITMAVDLTPITATIRARRTQTGVTARTRDITRTRMGAVIRTVVTTIITRTIRLRTAITDQRSHLCS